MKQAAQFEATTLDNGVRVVTERLPSSRAIAAGLLVDCGTRHEAAHENGLAHLCEHLLFQGTSNRDAQQIARQIDLVGGRVGAFTTRDYTCFVASVMQDYAYHGLDLMGDLLMNSTFPERALASERAAILQEIERQADQPETHLEQSLKAAIWSGHALGRPVSGTAERVARFTREDVIYFHHQHYVPGRLIVAAAGNVEHEEFVTQVHDCFWRLRGGEAAPAQASPAWQGVERLEVAQLRQVYFSLAWPAPAYASPDRYRLHVLTGVLGQGLSSRLFSELREQRGLVYEIQAEYQAYGSTGIFLIQGSTAPEHLEEVVTHIRESLEALCSGASPVSEEEVWLTGTRLRNSLMLTAADEHAAMTRLALQQLYFDAPISAEAILAELDAVTAESLSELVERWLRPALGEVALGVLGPPNCVSAFESLKGMMPRYPGRIGHPAFVAHAVGERNGHPWR
ncbi:MAG: insulinase family protein [Bryobacteraceae bacterium]|nr:insulinase family protein [Bryobacteraceae bacterium]